MTLLLDTHTLLWMLSKSTRLSKRARSALADRGNDLFLSIAGYWEIGIKISLGKLDLAPKWEETIPREMTRNGVSWLGIEPEHVATVAKLPWIHPDPFDRIMIAQALCKECTIITADPFFRDYSVPAIW